MFYFQGIGPLFNYSATTQLQFYHTYGNDFLAQWSNTIF